MSPVNLQGNRAVLSGSPERWYPFFECFTDLRAARPHARVLLANMDVEYGYRVIFKQIDWEPEIKMLPPMVAGNAHANLLKSIEYAQMNRFDVVIFRCGDWPLSNVGDAVGGYKIADEYPGRVGGLLVLVADQDSRSDDRQSIKN